LRSTLDNSNQTKYNKLSFYTQQEYILNSSNPLTVFEKIISPLLPILQKEADSIKNDTDTFRLSLLPFTLNLFYGIVRKTKSIALLITEIESASEQPLTSDLVKASGSMYSEAFCRYNPAIFRRIFHQLLEKLSFMEIEDLKTLGRFLCIDGSIFPAFTTMEWAHYKSTGNAIKMHLAFEINRMLPVKFISSDANASEKKALLSMLETGVTYIADRGYMSFSLFYQVTVKGAFFIIRVKSNLIYTVKEALPFEIPQQWQPYLSQVSDCKIFCKNDKRSSIYRLIKFVVNDETYFIMTNRFDLKTHEVIMLYAYRWQVELFFRCIKRTFGALHLWSQDQKGIEVQFYIYLIAYICLLHFKQNCEEQKELIKCEEHAKKSDKNPFSKPKHHSRTPVSCGMVSILNKQLKNYWKLGIHWLAALKNSICKPYTNEVILSL